ncbi:alpha/beta fold hydrolase [Paenibacillus harenae]|uniref:Pimeloyl-ACP methyl ester carboxylesterase n=1 Tax=Paenibacillus harenae TaxID=306543 RepID=A0ABT9U8M1_PAEHA|nr:alpha/beta hydrolase [Paenibacillus harenae]MDQ0114794.1 pimeloyl-ACP methyl ester carboxylesterase [Paenibacillus harenae]
MKEAYVEAGIIRYKDQGTGQAILFLHGALSNGNTWRKVIPAISKSFRCIVPDLPLGGHSIPLDPETDLTPTGLANLLKQFLDVLGLDDIILVGNDTGGAYAQVFTMSYPEKVSKLVLCNTDAFEIFPPKQFSLLKIGVNIPGFTFLMAQLFRIKPLLKTSMVLGLLSHTLSKEVLHTLYIHNFIHYKGVRADFSKVVRGWSPDVTRQAAEKLSFFNKPVLVIWGADDKKLFPVELGERIFSIFPDARFELVKNALTYVQEDQPEVFAHKLVHFIENTTFSK